MSFVVNYVSYLIGELLARMFFQTICIGFLMTLLQCFFESGAGGNFKEGLSIFVFLSCEVLGQFVETFEVSTILHREVL